MYFKREIKSSKIGTKFIPALKYGAFFGFSRKNLFFICILQRSSDQSLQDSSTTFLRRSNYKIQWERIWATCITYLVAGRPSPDRRCLTSGRLHSRHAPVLSGVQGDPASCFVSYLIWWTHTHPQIEANKKKEPTSSEVCAMYVSRKEKRLGFFGGILFVLVFLKTEIKIYAKNEKRRRYTIY